MKKFIVMMMFVVVAITAFAQKGRPLAFTADTVQSNETIYITVADDLSSKAPFSISILCTQLGGTSDGTISLQGNAGAGWEPLTDITDVIKGVGNDSLTITNAGVQVWLVQDNFFESYRIKIEGTADDTTLVSGYAFWPK